ncbi:MAG: hypothetical protein RIC87_00490 [Kiloniellales bacterium]
MGDLRAWLEAQGLAKHANLTGFIRRSNRLDAEELHALLQRF